MLDYLKKKYVELVASVLDPIATKVLALSLASRVALVIAFPGVWAAWEYRENVKHAVAFASRIAAVARAPSGNVPLSADLRGRAIDVAFRLRAASARDTNLVDSGELTGWSAAQALMAIANDPTHNSQAQIFAAYIREKQLKSCSCWAELNTEDERRSWLFISGWVLAAFSDAKIAGTESEIQYLLKHQNVDGSWTSTSNTHRPEFASTYATSWAIIGLSKQARNNLLSPELSPSAKSAVARGSAWLLNHRQNGSRWKPYPLLPASSPSGSVSGLALHALHSADISNLRDIDAQWLDNLPNVAVPASIGENSYVEIKAEQVLLIDHFVQLTMPWMLIATVDAYEVGSLAQRARSLAWIELLLQHDSIRNADTEQANWWRAEVATAMNKLALRVRVQ